MSHPAFQLAAPTPDQLDQTICELVYQYQRNPKLMMPMVESLKRTEVVLDALKGILTDRDRPTPLNKVTYAFEIGLQAGYILADKEAGRLPTVDMGVKTD